MCLWGAGVAAEAGLQDFQSSAGLFRSVPMDDFCMPAMPATFPTETLNPQDPKPSALKPKPLSHREKVLRYLWQIMSHVLSLKSVQV